MAKRDLQAKRDQLDVGCDVLVRRSGAERQYEGEIVNLYSTMAAVRLKRSDKIEMIALTKLTRVEDEPERKSATPPPPKQAPVLAVVVAPPPEPAPASPPDDVAAWFEMGKGIASGLEKQIAELNKEASDLRTTARELCQQASEVDNTREALEKKLAAVRSVAL